MEKKTTLSASLTLLIINVGMFIVQNILGEKFTNAFSLVSADVLSRPYILLSSMFLHANFTHLFFNMYALFMFGPLIEQRIGTKRFYLVYFLSGLGAALVALPFYDNALGASGAIMGIIGTTIMLMPDLRILLFFIIPLSLRTAGIIFILLDVFGVFFPTGIASAAHLGGMAVGLVYGWYLLRKKKQYQKKFVVKVKRKGQNTLEKNAILMNDEEINDYLEHGRL